MRVWLSMLLLLAAAVRPEAAAALIGDGDGTAEGAKRVFELFPPGDPYPTGPADPHRRGFGVLLASVDDVDIPESGDSRFLLKMGGRFGAFRFGPPDDPDRGWQLGIEVGFYGQFDNDRSQDNIGWDGFYGLVLTHGLGPGLAWKVGVMHTSAHVGDEYAERVGRQRIGYTREEALAGMTWGFSSHSRVYVEGGYGYRRRNEELMEPGRWQVGFAYERPKTFWGERLGWYAATDLSSWEERDWRVDVALQAGILGLAGPREWRIGVERYDGRPPMGEFFQATESYTAFGIWLDV